MHTVRITNRPYAYDVTEGRPAALGVKQNTATCVIAKHAARGANPASHTAGLAQSVLIKGHPKEFHVIVDHERVPQNSSNLFVHDLQKLVFSSAKIIPEITRFCCPKDA